MIINENLKAFKNKYPLSKTLRFELKPVGNTLKRIEQKGLLTEDQERAEQYQRMKLLIDNFHKSFIEKALQYVKLTQLDDFVELYNTNPELKKEDNYIKRLEKTQTALRKEIVATYKADSVKDTYSNLFKKELITKELITWVDNLSDKKDVEAFQLFTTYFKGFHENRKNIYSDKAQSTAIAYRLIHENLPRFIDNLKTFEKLKAVPDIYKQLPEFYKAIEEYLNVNTLDEVFELNNYNQTLSQNDIDVYNLILGGRTAAEGEKKIQGLNERINLYNQKQDKKHRLPKFKMLYKQILSDRNNLSFLPDEFTKNDEVFDAIRDFYTLEIKEYESTTENKIIDVLSTIEQKLAEIENLDCDKIYLKNDTSITHISKQLFGDWSVIKSALEYHFVSQLTIGKKGINTKQTTALNKYLKQPFINIAEIERALDTFKSQTEALKNYNFSNHPVANYFKENFKIQKPDGKTFDFASHITEKYNAIKGILNGNYTDEKKLYQDKPTVTKIKEFLDALNQVLHFVKPLALPTDSVLEKDEIFYAEFSELYDQLKKLIPLYNKVRNYATQKPYSDKKVKLNFENSTLLAGWDVNKEKDNTSILLQKDGLYYLGIMNKSHNKIFDKIKPSEGADSYQKINYKLLPGASKMLPKVFFSNKNIEHYSPSEKIIQIRNYGTHTKGGSPQTGYEKQPFSLNDCHEMIDFFKASIQKHPEWNLFGFKFSDTKSYDSIDGFYREVEAQGYNITHTPIATDYINNLINDGKLYLFQIYNKDFSKFSKGKPNLHTLYWKALFDTDNLKDVVYKLNGEAEIFYRKKSINKLTVHPAKQTIKNKNPQAVKKESTFDYELVKDKRYTVDKFQFHVPITLNFKAQGNSYINNDVLDYLKKHPDVNIIGLDRGERHLIYLTLINQKGEILQQETLNSIVNKQHNITTPYHTLLQNRENERAKARENWGVVENIKELKEGYISQVVHKIAKMMVEHNAIVVMEDLNTGFKRGRFKVEKQVYQKLEKMLIDKLNYFVSKDVEPNKPGGLFNALQLTNKFESFSKMGKQSGFLFYVPAWNTSKIDPTTGFVNLFNTKYTSVDKAIEFFQQFDSIKYNTKAKYFEFTFNYNNFTTRAEGTQTNWTVCTHGDRILTFRNPDANNQWDNKSVQLTQQFEVLFGKNNISYGDGNCIKSQIVQITERSFLKSLLDNFKLTLQMRNSITNSEVDYLVSPVKNAKGSFYDSRQSAQSLPKDADANGAYHIAKKGLMWLNQIHEHNDDWKNLKLEKTNKAWLNYAQNNPAQ